MAVVRRATILLIALASGQASASYDCFDMPTPKAAYEVADFVAMAKLTKVSPATGFEKAVIIHFEISEYLKGSAPKQLSLTVDTGMVDAPPALQYLLFLKNGQTGISPCECCMYSLNLYLFQWYSNLRESRGL